MASVGHASAATGDAVPVLRPKSSSERVSSVKPSPLDEGFRKFAEETLKKWHVPGVSVAVIDGDETFSNGYGFATLPDKLVEASTLFYAGSTTKTFTAAAASLVVDDNEHINWTTPMNRLIRDDFVLQDEYATSHVTIEDALSHRTGLPGHTFTFAGKTPRESVRNLRNLYMNKEIRTTWQYCNLMFIAVSHMIEVVTGEWLGDFMRKRIWNPLGMNSTFLSLKDAQQFVQEHEGAHLARGYTWVEDESTNKEVSYWDLPVVSGAGHMISNVLDYAKYVRSMINESGPLSKEAYAELISPRAIMPPMDPHFTNRVLYCLGWMTSMYHGEPVIYHPGGLDGFTATMIYLPEKKWGVVAMQNMQGPCREALVWHLIDEFLGVPKEKRVDLFEITEKSKASAKEMFLTAQERLYPSAPSPPLPPTLPLSEYVGTYTHPAYPPFEISLTSDAEPRLYATAVGGAVAVVLKLKQVSSNFFLAEMVVFEFTKDPSQVVRAEFQVDAKGIPRFGAEIDFISEGKMIWWERSV